MFTLLNKHSCLLSPDMLTDAITERALSMMVSVQPFDATPPITNSLWKGETLTSSRAAEVRFWAQFVHLFHFFPSLFGVLFTCAREKIISDDFKFWPFMPLSLDDVSTFVRSFVIITHKTEAVPKSPRKVLSFEHEAICVSHLITCSPPHMAEGLHIWKLLRTNNLINSNLFPATSSLIYGSIRFHKKPNHFSASSPWDYFWKIN